MSPQLEWRRRHILRATLAALLVASAALEASGATAAADARRAECSRPPIIVLPGIMGSDLDVRLFSTLGAPCGSGLSSFTLWPPFNPDLLTNWSCFKYLLQPVPCSDGGNGGDDGDDSGGGGSGGDGSGSSAGSGSSSSGGGSGGSGGGGGGRGSMCSNPGVRTWVDPGGVDGTKTFAFKQGGYTKLVDFLERELGYSPGRDLFAAPYDWRLDLSALDEGGQFDAIARRVSAAVARNCGRKAILVGHSMGTVVSLGLLQHPAYAAWREANVQAYVALAPPLGGTTYAIASKLGGNRVNLLQALGDLLQPLLNELIYHGSRGLPSMLMLMPYPGIWGRDHVLVSTPERNYTLGGITSLFEAIGDTQSAELYDQVHDLNTLVAKGPVPGVPTYCIYGSGVPTVQSWSYSRIVRDRPAAPGTATPRTMGDGDGVVNVESMRLCSRLTNASRIFELGGGVNHGNVVYHPDALDVVKTVLREVLSGAA
ncbi:Pla2g15 [Scenedesmus sp. PABB004]|nr:Pla2g15 [Scenedesmus sp. PABB004]